MAKGSKNGHQQAIIFVGGICAGVFLTIFISNLMHGFGIAPLYMQFLGFLAEAIMLLCTISYFNYLHKKK